jgi:hypothetical protein
MRLLVPFQLFPPETKASHEATVAGKWNGRGYAEQVGTALVLEAEAQESKRRLRLTGGFDETTVVT